MDYYSELGVDKHSSDADIKLAYRRLARLYHPDKNKSPEAEDKIKRVNEAYEVIGDRTKRAEYDRQQTKLFSGFCHTKVDINDVFGGAGFSKKPKKNNIKKTFERNSNLTIKIDFSEAILGVTNKKINQIYKHECHICHGHGGQFDVCSDCNGTGMINKNDGFISINVSCKKCDSTGKRITSTCPVCGSDGYIEKNEELIIKIPEGLDQRTKLFVKGKGNYINGSRGDLFVNVEIKQNNTYTRQGNDILVNTTVNVLDILIEKTVFIDTFRGKISVDLSVESFENDIVIKGLGTKSVKGVDYGDMIIKLKLFFPDLTNEQKKIINGLI